MEVETSEKIPFADVSLACLKNSPYADAWGFFMALKKPSSFS
ncbi:hypothetical protein [Bacillus alveayuensis]|jgi:hypothetical protein|nr:hypothetical protein [Bacillus alveayuensis]